MNPWIYQGLPMLSAPADCQGFVYLITNLQNNRKYIGKKNFRRILKRKPLAGKTNRRHSIQETDWQSYYGSNKELQEDVATLGPNTITREILKLCPNKTMMSYWETKLQFEHDVLLSDDYYNQIISCRINGRGIKMIS
jgi:hypothetical protein